MSHRFPLPLALPAVLLGALLLAGAPGTAAAAPEELREFDTPAQRERYRALLGEVRCLVCQNESLASSNADLAQDLRDEIYRLVVEEGRSKQAAIDFLVQRYGDFVLYRPPVQPSTWLLWFGPLLMLAAGAAAAAVVIRRRRAAPEPGLSPDDHARAERLLQGDADEPGDGR